MGNRHDNFSSPLVLQLHGYADALKTVYTQPIKYEKREKKQKTWVPNMRQISVEPLIGKKVLIRKLHGFPRLHLIL